MGDRRTVGDGKKCKVVNYDRDEKEGDRDEGGDACAAVNESKMKEERDEEQLKD